MLQTWQIFWFDFQLNRVKAVEKEKDNLEGPRNEAVQYLCMENDIVRQKNKLYQKYMWVEENYIQHVIIWHKKWFVYNCNFIAFIWVEMYMLFWILYYIWNLFKPKPKLIGILNIQQSLQWALVLQPKTSKTLFRQVTFSVFYLDIYIYMSKNMVFELLVSFGIQMVKY